jgi:N-acetylglucosamine-6-phosphate deacetylase
MIVLSGAEVVLANRIQSPATVILGDDRILEVQQGTRSASPGSLHFDLHDHYVVPGFIDVHVHGLEGFDTLDARGGVREMAVRLARFGVTAFCPTSIACAPRALAALLAAVRELRLQPEPAGARVLPAHLESNFINPEYRGAHPEQCLRRPPAERSVSSEASDTGRIDNDYTAEDLLAEIARARSDVGIVTLAPELDGALPLIERLVADGHRISLGHSGATFEQAMAGIRRGARAATHLFNRMSPFAHRDPGLVGAVLASDEVAAELICDGYHVHPAVLQVAIAAKHPDRVMAITDATAGAGLPIGARAALGGRAITVRESAAYLDDGTLAGSVLTMDRAFGLLVRRVGLSLPDAATICSTTPARELGLRGLGMIAPGALADLTVLDRNLTVAQTYVGGRLVYTRA